MPQGQAGAGAALASVKPKDELTGALRQLVDALSMLVTQLQSASGGGAPGGASMMAAPPVTPSPMMAAAPAAPSATGTFQAGAKPTQGMASVASSSTGQQLDLTGFSTAQGPDLHVYLTPGTPPDGSPPADYIDLGALSSSTGNQNYAIPPGTDLSKYNTVDVWCAQAKASFGSAKLM
jgi:hypothetical protein